MISGIERALDNEEGYTKHGSNCLRSHCFDTKMMRREVSTAGCF